MNKLVVISLVTSLVGAADARPRSSTSPQRARLDQIDAAVTAVVKRIKPLPADAQETEKLAAAIDRIGAQAKAALTPNLRVVALYDSLVEDVAKLPALAAAVRASWPCRDGIRQLGAASAADRIAGADEIRRVVAACEAYESAARGTKLQSEATRAERELDKQRDGVTATALRAQQRVAAQQAEAKRAEQQSITVMGQFLDVTLEDSKDPAKIAAAFERAPIDLVYSKNKGARLSLQPFEGAPGSGCRNGETTKIEAGWYHNGEASSLEIFDANVDETAGVPLLIWKRDGNTALVVSLDGLRYTTEQLDKTLMKGAPPRASWPKAPHLVCLTEEMATRLVEQGALDAALVAKAEKTREASEACVSRTWKSGEREIAANDMANITQNTRANRYSALLDKYTNKVERSCAGQRKSYEAAMLAVMTSYAKPRVEALAAATAALAAK